jgi:hypothetical protein
LLRTYWRVPRCHVLEIAMPLKRDQSKALQIGFLVLLAVSSAQVVWWTAENVTHSRNLQNTHFRPVPGGSARHYRDV